MGYTTYFAGQFNLNKKLDKETHEFLDKLARTRRMARNVGPEYGVEGEFYVEGKGFMGQDREDNIIDNNRPPSTQPGLWLQWVPTEDGTAIVWDEGEKFYNYVEWIEYLIEKILAPRGYILNGKVDWRGEDFDDLGCIIIENNQVRLGSFGQYVPSLDNPQTEEQPAADPEPQPAEPEVNDEPEVHGPRKIQL